MNGMKRVSVRLTPEADEAYEYLISKASDSKQEETILNAFHQKIELIKNDVHYGNPVAKRLIPSEYKTKSAVLRIRSMKTHSRVKPQGKKGSLFGL